MGIELAQGRDHLHVQLVVGHRVLGILRLNEVEAEIMRVRRGEIGGGYLEAENDLGEDGCRWHIAQHLIEIAHLDGAGGCRMRGLAMLQLAALLLKAIHLVADSEGLLAEAAIEQLLAPCGVAGAGWNRLGLRDDSEGNIRRVHQLEILLVLRCGARGHLVYPFRRVASGHAFEVIEGGKEVVVSAVTGFGHEGAHGEGVDQLVVERLMFEQRRRTDRAGGAWLSSKGNAMAGEVERLRIDADVVQGGIAQKGLRVDCACEMTVQITTLGHALKKRVKRERTGRTRLLHGGCGQLFRRMDLRMCRKKLRQSDNQQSKLREAGAKTLHA